MLQVGTRLKKCPAPKGLVIFKTGYPVGVIFRFWSDFFGPLTEPVNIFVPLNCFWFYFTPLKVNFIPLKSSLQNFRPLKSSLMDFRPLSPVNQNLDTLRPIR